MTEAQNKESSHWWWLDSHSKVISNRSPWLQSTIADLDHKTKGVIEIIEADADSFAQRAEMFYKKRPELISIIQDLYSSHRSLAEQYDHHIKPDPGPRVTPWSFSFNLTTKCQPEKSFTLNDKAYDSYDETNGPEESYESEIDDPEEVMQEMLTCNVNEELMRLRDEVEKLRTENLIQTEQLKQKDEEKRDVIRQLSLAMDLLRDENSKLRRSLAKNSPKKQIKSNTSKPIDDFLGRLFNGLVTWV